MTDLTSTSPAPDEAPQTGLTSENIAARKGRITASVFPIIEAGGKAAYNEMQRIARERLGLADDKKHFTTSAMQRGIVNEAEAVAATQQIYPNLVHNTKHITAGDKIGATPDTLMIDGNRIIGTAQIKTAANEKNYQAYAKQADKAHITQVLFERYVLEESGAAPPNAQFVTLLVYSRFNPKSKDDITCHKITIAPCEWAKARAQFTETLESAEQIIATIMKAGGEYYANPLIAEIAGAKAKKKAITERARELKRRIDALASQAIDAIDIPPEREDALLAELAGWNSIKPPGVRATYRAPKAVVTDPEALPARYWKRVPDTAAALADAEKHIAAGVQPDILGIEVLPPESKLTILADGTSADAVAEFNEAAAEILR